MQTADHGVTAPLIPRTRVRRPWFLAHSSPNGGPKWSESEVKVPALPCSCPRGGGIGVSNDWCINVTIIVTLNSSKCVCNSTKFLPECLKQYFRDFENLNFPGEGMPQIPQFCLIFSDHQQLKATNYWLQIQSKQATKHVPSTKQLILATVFFKKEKKNCMNDSYCMPYTYLLLNKVQKAKN